MRVEADTIDARPATGLLAGQLAGSGLLAPRFFAALVATAKTLWPKNTPANLATATGYSTDHCKRVLKQTRRMNAEKAMELALSGVDDGLLIETYIESLPDEERDRAWGAVRAALRRVELRDRIDADRDELEALQGRMADLSTRRR